MMSNQSSPNNVEDPINTASPEVREIVERVLQLEKEKLYQKSPKINDDILKIIKEVVQ